MKRKQKFTDVRDYPIFEVGTWNGMEFAEADLDEIAANFHEFKGSYDVPLKLGHNDEQPVTDGQPALGWVTNVRRHGKQLLASFEKMPSIIKELISKGRYRKVSIELICGMTKGGKKLKYLLDAVAILGADRPAVSTLPDLSRYLAKRSLAYDEGGRRVAFESDAGKRTFTSNATQRGVPAMEDDAEDAGVNRAIKFRDDQITDLEKQVKDLKIKLAAADDVNAKLTAEVTTLKSKDKEREDDARKSKIKHAREIVTAVFEEAVKEKVITPAQRDSDMLFAEVDNDEKVIKLAANIDTLKARYPKPVKKDNKGSGDNKRFSNQNTASGGNDDEMSPNRTHKDVFAEVNHRVAVLQGANARLSFSDALKSVLRADRELAKEYANTNPPVRASAGGN